MHALRLPALDRFRHLAPVIVRVTVGVIMAVHGWQKLTAMGPANLGARTLEPAGIPAPTVVPGAGLDLALIAGLATVALLGPGSPSLGQQVGLERQRAGHAREPVTARP